MINDNELELFIAQGIEVLRKERRKRPQKKDIYYYVQDFQENYMLDYDIFSNIFDNMIEEGKIYDKYKDLYDKESFYNKSQINNSQIQNTPFCDVNNPLVTPSKNSLNNLDNLTSPNTTTLINIKDLNTLIEKKVNESIAPYINNLASLLNDYEKMITEKDELEQLNVRIKYELKDLDTAHELNKQLSKENAFLKKELQSKDVIIKMLLDERSKVIVKDIKNDTNIKVNKSNNDVQSTVVENNNLAGLDHKAANISSEETEFSIVNRKKSNKRQITLIGDSIIKNIEAHRMKACMKSNEKIYVKSFPGAKLADMQDYVRPSQRYDPDLFILHTGSNDLNSVKTPEEISEEIIKLALNLKTDKNEIVVSGIIGRKDQHNGKGVMVNKLLKTKCATNTLGFMDNTNILIKKHLNGSGIHLNHEGTKALADNFLKIIDL